MNGLRKGRGGGKKEKRIFNPPAQIHMDPCWPPFLLYLHRLSCLQPFENVFTIFRRQIKTKSFSYKRALATNRRRKQVCRLKGPEVDIQTKEETFY